MARPPANERIVVDRRAFFRRDRARTFDFVMMRDDGVDMVDARLPRRTTRRLPVFAIKHLPGRRM